MNRKKDNITSLPEEFSDLFWEYDLSDLDWDEHRDFIVRRVLSHGTWRQIGRLRDRIGDEELRRVIMDSEGRELSPKQLRFWQLILDLPAEKVDRWLQSARRHPWEQRIS